MGLHDCNGASSAQVLSSAVGGPGRPRRRCGPRRVVGGPCDRDSSRPAGARSARDALAQFCGGAPGATGAGRAARSVRRGPPPVPGGARRRIALEAYGTRRTCRVPDRARRRRRPVPRALAHAVRVFASRGGSFAPRGGLCRVLDAEAGSLSMQRQIGVPSALVAVIEGLTMLFVLAATVRRA